MTNLSAVIITHNEEKNIERCIISLLGVADEIIVMDSYSSDSTEEICKKHQVRFYQQEWKGYGEQKNDANSKASFDYILSIDADEVLSDELRKSVQNQKSKGLSGVYKVKRTANFCGQFIRYGHWNPDIKPRIFNRQLVKWNNREVHESLIVPNDQRYELLSGALLHYTSDNVEEFLATTVKYAKLGAEAYNRQGKRTSPLFYIFKPAFSFLNSFILRLGFLDGAKGFILARISAKESYIKYSTLYELQKRNKIN